MNFLHIAIILSALEEEPESDDEEDDTKIMNTSTKRPASGGGAKTPQVYILSISLSAEFSTGLVLPACRSKQLSVEKDYFVLGSLHFHNLVLVVKYR